MTVNFRKEQHNLFDINKYKNVRWKSKKKKNHIPYCYLHQRDSETEMLYKKYAR